MMTSIIPMTCCANLAELFCLVVDCSKMMTKMSTHVSSCSIFAFRLLDNQSGVEVATMPRPFIP